MPPNQRQEEVTDQARVVNSGYREETGLLLGNEFQTYLEPRRCLLGLPCPSGKSTEEQTSPCSHDGARLISCHKLENWKHRRQAFLDSGQQAA